MIKEGEEETEKTGMVSGAALMSMLMGKEEYMKTIRRDIGFICNAHDKRTPDSIRRQIKECIAAIAGKYGFELPEKHFFSLIYTIGKEDMDCAHLFDPEITGRLFIDFPKYENIQNISRGLSKRTQYPVLAVSRADVFNFPKLMLFENGKMKKKIYKIG